MTWQDKIAGVAGGTLGYIAGNVGGAISGYAIAENLSKSMRRNRFERDGVVIAPNRFATSPTATNS